MIMIDFNYSYKKFKKAINELESKKKLLSWHKEIFRIIKCMRVNELIICDIKPFKEFNIYELIDLIYTIDKKLLKKAK